MKRTLTVTGQGQSRAVPDRAVLRIGIAHRAPGVADAVAGVDSGVRLAGEVARRFTTPARIGSQGLNLWPAHDQEGRQVGFEARHQLAIACDNLDVAGKLVGALAAEVGDRLQIGGVSLEVSDPSAAQTAAREEAYADATARAEHLAGLSGATLGEVVSVVEGGGATPFMGGDIPASAKLDASFEPGESTIAAAVTVTWRLA